MDGIRVDRYAGDDTIHENNSTCRLVGASMLTFSIDPQWGNMYFWLGKEKRNIRWPEGSETWSDFGGRPHENETSHDIAAREFVEESCGTLHYFPSDTYPRCAWDDISRDLKQGNYLFRITMWTVDGEGVKKLFITYVKQIPWQPHSAERYAKDMAALMHIKMTIKHSGSTPKIPVGFKSPALKVHTDVKDPTNKSYQINRDFMEKEMIRMWSIPRLHEAIENYIISEGSPFKHHLDHCKYRDTPVNIGFKRIDRFRNCFVTLLNCVLKEIMYYEPSVVESPSAFALDSRSIV